MMLFCRRKHKEDNGKKRDADNAEIKLSKSLDENINIFKQIFANVDTFEVRIAENRHYSRVKCCIMFIDGMVDDKIVNDNILRPFMQSEELSKTADITGMLQSSIINSNSVKSSSDIDKLTEAVISGDIVLFADGSEAGLVIGAKGWQTRQIGEPEGERVDRGPREGFVESLTMNLVMIRRKIQSPDLKMKFMTLGRMTRTKICVCYIEGITEKKILDEVYRRLERINIDSVLDTGYISEIIADAPYSPMKTVGDTERPDTVAGKLLEGRIAILAEGTPVALTVPYIFLENFQINEDYYKNYFFSSIGRILRILGFIITISFPAIYLAIVAFHRETIPTPLLLSISSARKGVPFPTIIEIALMLFIFELLRETGIRMPSYVGQSLNIVGALVLGTASVEARIVSAPIIIVVSVSAITGLIIPGIKGATIIFRIIFLLLAAIMGLYGVVFGFIGLLIHLCEIRSFGIPYMLTLTNFNTREMKDTLFRAPWWEMKRRPKLLTMNRTRQKSGKRKQ